MDDLTLTQLLVSMTQQLDRTDATHVGISRTLVTVGSTLEHLAHTLEYQTQVLEEQNGVLKQLHTTLARWLDQHSNGPHP